MKSRVSKAQPSFRGQLLKTITVRSPPVADAPARSAKRQLDEIDNSPPKKARLANAQQPEVKREGTEPADKTPVLQHPKPNPPYASFLGKSVDPSEPGPRANSEHSFILERLESVASDQDARCRSDSHLQTANDSPIPGGLVRLAPVIGNTRDSDIFTVAPTPASTRSRSRPNIDGRSTAPFDSTGLSSGQSMGNLVEHPTYRLMNLAANNIYMRPPPPHTKLPEQIASIVDNARKDRDSPGPSLEEVRRNNDLAAMSWNGASEYEVENFFRDNIFPSCGSTDSLQRTDRQPMAKHTAPGTNSDYKISNPVPQMLYGYNQQNAFPQQQAQLISMGKEMAANNQGLIYPFFAIEFKGESAFGSGSLWVATNKCLGDSASCIKMVESLQDRLKNCENDMVQPIDSAAFSIAMSGTEARLYISWKNNELDYYMASIDCFLLQDPEHYLKFRKYVRNIIDWGRGERLKQIRESLDSLLEESRKRTSAVAKFRMPPSAESATSSSSSSSYKTRKTSQHSKIKGVQQRTKTKQWC